jgi:hypothetical protein
VRVRPRHGLGRHVLGSGIVTEDATGHPERPPEEGIEGFFEAFWEVGGS